MKILHVIDSCHPKIGGPIEGIKQLNMMYRKYNISVNLLSSNTSTEIIKFKKDLPKIYATGPSLGKFSYNKKMLIWLQEKINNYSLVFIHGIWQYHNYAVWKIAKENNIPFFIFPHGSLDPWFNQKYPLKYIKKIIYWYLLQYKILSDSSGLIFTSNSELRLACKSFNIKKIKKFIVRYGINGNPLYPFKKDMLFEKKLNLPNKKLILYIGRISEKKGIDILIKSFFQILKISKDFHLVIAGPSDKKYLKFLYTLIPAELTSNISWPGPLYGDDKWKLLNSCSLFCSASHQENFGISIVEALSSKKPVLTTNIVNIFKTIKKYNAGIITNDNYKSFLNGFKRFIYLDKKDYDCMKKNSYKCSQEKFHLNNYFIDLKKILIKTNKRK